MLTFERDEFLFIELKSGRIHLLVRRGLLGLQVINVVCLQKHGKQVEELNNNVFFYLNLLLGNSLRIFQ